MIVIDEKINELNSTDAKYLDKEFSTMIYTLKDVPRMFNHVFNFKCKDIKNWEYFANNNDGGVYFDGNEIFSVFLNKNIPFFRFYFFSTSDSVSLSILIKKYKAIDFKSSRLLKTILDPSLVNESKQWFKTQEEGFKNSTTIAEGRTNNTTIEQSFLIRREPDGCFVCGKKPTGYVSTIISLDKTRFVIADICDEHKEECKQYKCVLDYIFQKLDSSIDFPDTTQEEKINPIILDYLYQEIEKELDATELQDKRKHRIKKGEDEYSATFQRNSGFMIYIRLTSLMDYGYVINNPDKTQFKRIDSEDHHNDILDFGSDHIHNKPKDDIKVQREEKTIQSSYTTGFPLFDLPSIKQMLLDAEKEWLDNKL